MCNCQEDEMPRREKIIVTVKDLVGDFMYYGRKEDEELPVGEIEAAVNNGEITVDEIVNVFRSELDNST
jgi:hypothetical protein